MFHFTGANRQPPTDPSTTSDLRPGIFVYETPLATNYGRDPASGLREAAEAATRGAAVTVVKLEKFR